MNYISKSLLDVETRYAYLDQLILALVVSSTKLCPYVESYTIILKTNYLTKIVLRKLELTGQMAK